MPRTARPWFRFYSEALGSLKVHNLPDKLVKPWVLLLCRANINEPRGRLPTMPEIAFTLRVKEDRAKAIVEALVKHRFIDVEDGGGYVMHQWDDWQRESDVRETEGRRNADELRHKVGGKWIVSDAESPPLRGANPRATDAESPPLRQRSAETDQIRERAEAEAEAETEREQNARAPGEGFAFQPGSSQPDEHGFVGEWTRAQERLTGKPPSSSSVVDAARLERDFGFDACLEVAVDTGWAKPPSWLRKKLENRPKAVARRDSKPDYEIEEVEV